jgi:hypothetical protein
VQVHRFFWWSPARMISEGIIGGSDNYNSLVWSQSICQLTGRPCENPISSSNGSNGLSSRCRGPPNSDAPSTTGASPRRARTSSTRDVSVDEAVLLQDLICVELQVWLSNRAPSRSRPSTTSTRKMSTVPPVRRTDIEGDHKASVPKMAGTVRRPQKAASGLPEVAVPS